MPAICEPDLFSYAARYPVVAGWKADGTSREAAQKTDARTLRASVMARLDKDGALTADEVAERLGESVLSIRPRFSELLRLGKIRDSGGRRQNLSGRNAVVWEII